MRRFGQAASDAGPFSWDFKSSESEDGEYSWVGYRLSTESAWHRCIRPPGSVSLSNLPDGVYSITIANDLSGFWLLGKGLSGSSFVEQECGPESGTRSPPHPTTTSPTLTIDSTPPEIAHTGVITEGKTAKLWIEATDELTGVAPTFHIAWGDGLASNVQPSSPAGPDATHTYLSYGTYSGSVTVQDNAGYSTTKPFTANLPKPLPTGSTRQISTNGGETSSVSGGHRHRRCHHTHRCHRHGHHRHRHH